ncbi:hypothetical protein FRC04_003137 [Tulasnella sp. 424]|nr:hypothetical protein FRC04_003137 [Tulasnella sp. 424]
MDYDDDEAGEGNVAGASQSQADGANKKRAGGTGGLGPEEIKRRANDLVRMALFEEPRRQTLRRTEIIKKGGVSRGSSGQSSGTFILRSTLNPDLIRLANKKNDKLYEKEVKSVRALGLIGKKPEDQNYERPSGAILAWKSVEPLAPTGIL